MKPLGLLFLTHQGNMAGSTNSIAFLAHGLAQRGHRVFVGGRPDTLLFELLADSGVGLLPIPFSGKFDVESWRRIRDAVRTHSIDVVNAQSGIDRYASIFARWRWRLPVKVVHTRRQVPMSSGGRPQTWFYRLGTDRIVVISESLKEVFRKKGFPESHLQVIHNGTPAERYEAVDPARTAALRTKYDLPADVPVVGCISRMKNQTQLLDAAALLDRPLRLLFVGIRPGSLDEHAARIGLRHPIAYAGQVDGDDVLNHYRLCDVQVLPSTMDGFGLVLVEAMALGVPVVATRSTGIVDVVRPEKNGLLFEDGDAAGLAGAIERILDDAPLRDGLIAAGRETALVRFSLENTLDRYERFFRELVDSA